MKTLLILLVGEMAGPFSGELSRVLPEAFEHPLPEVVIGEIAPAGRSVAWVTLSSDSNDIELLLHTARVPGDLRRVLHFQATDSLAQRASAVAFALSNMALQREADLNALLPAPQPAAEAAEAPWSFVASPLAVLDVPGVSPGGGVAVRLERAVARWLRVGATLEAAVVSAAASTLFAPAALFELTVHWPKQGLSPMLSLGGGAMAWVLNHHSERFVSWLPVARVAVGARWLVWGRHSVQALVAAHLSTTMLRVSVAGAPAGTVGPATARLECGYVGSF